MSEKKVLLTLNSMAVDIADIIKTNVLLQAEILKLKTNILVLEVKLNELKLNQKSNADDWI